MIARALVLGMLLLALPAHAGSVAVVATGDGDLQPTLAAQLESWLRGHGHTIGAPLSIEAVSTLRNCMVMDDQGCARGVVDAQAKTDAVRFGQAIRSRASDSVVLDVYWFSKGEEPIGMRRACDACTVDLMRSTVEQMLGTVIRTSTQERGRVLVQSRPPGMIVLLDNQNIGVTPIEREVAAGEHEIVLMHRGRTVGQRTLKVHADVTAEILIPVTIPEDTAPAGDEGSRVLPALLLGLGVAAIATGVVLYTTSEVDDGTRPTYRDSKPAGIGVAAGGLVIAGIGGWLWVRAGRSVDSAPVATMTSTGGYLGWSRAF
jgi:hypothetical protein